MTEAMVRTRVMPPDLSWGWSLDTPMSQGWRADNIGGFLYVAAQYPINQLGRVVGVGDIEVQTRQVFSNVTAVLREGGAAWENVVFVTTRYVYQGPREAQKEFWEKMTRVRMEFYSSPSHSGTGLETLGYHDPDILISAYAIALLP